MRGKSHFTDLGPCYINATWNSDTRTAGILSVTERDRSHHGEFVPAKKLFGVSHRLSDRVLTESTICGIYIFKYLHWDNYGDT